MIEQKYNTIDDKNTTDLYETLKLQELFRSEDKPFDFEDVESVLLEEIENKGFLVAGNY